MAKRVVMEGYIMKRGGEVVEKKIIIHDPKMFDEYVRLQENDKKQTEI